MQTLFTRFLNWELRKGHGFYGIPGKAYTSLVPGQHSEYPGSQHTLVPQTKRVTPVRQVVVVVVVLA